MEAARTPQLGSHGQLLSRCCPERQRCVHHCLAKYPRQVGWAFHGGDSWRIMPKAQPVLQPAVGLHHPVCGQKNNLSFIDPNGPNPDAVTSAGTERPDGWLSQEQSLVLPATALAIPRYRSRRASLPALGLPTRSMKKPSCARVTDSSSDSFLSRGGRRSGPGRIQEESHFERILRWKLQNPGHLSGVRHLREPGRSNAEYLRRF